MHLCELYSLTAGVPLKRPILNDTFFPLPFEKYIVLHATTKPAKTYDFFECVLYLLLPELEKHGIKVVEIGSNGQPQQKGTHSLIGQTSMNQTFGVIKNSMLVLGVDSIALHAAGVYDVPLVGLYSNANYVECIKPYFGSPEKQVLIRCESNQKPSFAAEEVPKSINNIKPESIVKAVCDLLGIPFEYGFRTIEICPGFIRSYIEGIPNQSVDVRPLGLDALVVRMDELFNEEGLVEQAKLSKVSIVTHKPVNLNMLKAIKPQIAEIVYELREDNDPKWVAEVQKLGIRIGIFSFLSSEKLNPFKEAYLDLPMINERPSHIPDSLKSIPPEKLFVISNRFILSSSKVYPSIAHFKENQTIPNFGFYMVPVTKSSDIWKEHGCFWYLEKIVD